MKHDLEKLKELLEYATPLQCERIQAVIDTGTYAKAAMLLGMDESSVRQAVKRAKKAYAKQMSPTSALDPDETPVGFSIERISKHIDKEGNVSGWVIANRDKEDRFNAMMEAWTEFCTTLPKAELTTPPSNTMGDLLCDYTIGDAHIGMYAWAEEAGDDWNLDMGVDVMRKAMNHLVCHAPAAETAFILDVGDYFHSDNNDNETSRSKNKLDVDTRWAKVLRVGVAAMCDLIDMALQKHNKVVYRSVIGNHNDHTEIMMNLAMKMRYADEPRVEVQDSANTYNYYQFGVNLLADTHGHNTRAENLPLIMATDVPDLWAKTTNRVWRTGHVHRLSQKEYMGCSVVTYRTLAPKDAWHSSSGYRSNRDMRVTIYHKDRGTVGMHITNPSMLGYV